MAEKISALFIIIMTITKNQLFKYNMKMLFQVNFKILWLNLPNYGDYKAYSRKGLVLEFW